MKGTKFSIKMQQKILKHHFDAYNSVKIHANEVPITETEFSSSLLPTLQYLQEKKVRNVLIFLYLKHSDYMKHLVQQGFKLHHTYNGTQIALTKWLPDTPDKFPPYASHYVGVGGVCINPVDETI